MAGGRVVADWPGLGPGRLFEGRDLAPTLDLRRAAVEQVARESLGNHQRRAGGVQVEQPIELRRSVDVGDAIEVKDFVTGEPTQVPLAGPANRQGRIAADNIFGRDVRYRGTQGTAIVRVAEKVDVTDSEIEAGKDQLRDELVNTRRDKFFGAYMQKAKQGLKITTGGGIAEAVAKALGASAFVKPAPESYELLSSGVADGVFFPLESIISFKLDTVLEQATLFPGGMYSSAFGFFMNEDKWKKLHKVDQDAIDDQLEHGWCHPNGSNRKRFPLGDGLGGNVHHARAALRINVTEFLHRFLNYRSTRGITS